MNEILHKKLDLVDIYPVTCESLSNGRTDIDVLKAVIDAGVKIIQLRDKISDKSTLFKKAVQFRELTANADVLFLINDHVDLAQAVDADGIHIGQNDLSLEVARDLLPSKIIGWSTHNLEQALEGEKMGASYVNIGPIYSTKTKDHLTHFLGPSAIQQIAKELSIPFTVMGGIKEHHFHDLMKAGARKIAMVTAITQADDMMKACQNLRNHYQTTLKGICS